MLILILGVSAAAGADGRRHYRHDAGWKWIFLLLAMIVAAIMLVVFRYLPQGHQPDPSISLRPRHVIAGFGRSSVTGNFAATRWPARSRSAACSSM